MNHKEELNVDEGLRGNEQIEEAIAALQQEPSQEMLAHTLTCIRRRMNENGQVIIAVEPPVGDQGMQVQAVQTDDGANWWVAFTGFEEAVTCVKNEMIPDEYVTKLASFFKSVSEENRVRMIFALSKREMCVNDIAAALGISQSLVSHQLKLLKLEGQVKSRREGKNVYYSLDDQHVVDIFEEALKHIMHRMEEGNKS